MKAFKTYWFFLLNILLISKLNSLNKNQFNDKLKRKHLQSLTHLILICSIFPQESSTNFNRQSYVMSPCLFSLFIKQNISWSSLLIWSSSWASDLTLYFSYCFKVYLMFFKELLTKEERFSKFIFWFEDSVAMMFLMCSIEDCLISFISSSVLRLMFWSTTLIFL